MNDLDVSLELHPTCQKLPTDITRKQFLGDLLPFRVDPVLPRPVSGQRHGRGVLGGAVLAAEGPVNGMFGSLVVLECHRVYETILATNFTLKKCFIVDRSKITKYIIFCSDLIDNTIASAGAGPLVELVVVPSLERLATGGAVDLLVGLLLSVLPLDAVVPLHHVGVQRLLVLGRVVAALPRAGEPHVLALPVLLVVVLVQ